MNRRLSRCRENRIVAGVASGVAEFFGIDPTLVRVLWFISIFFGGVGLLLYFGMAIIVPLEPIGESSHPAVGTASVPEGHRHNAGAGGRWVTFFGVALILLGSLALLGAVIPDVASWRYLGPLFIIGMGAVLVAGAMRRDDPATEPPAPIQPGMPTQEPTES